ncbi:MAG: carboxypeptidase regulatory-like domain-containing protein, partial [Thaumarchaeota archaeon]|nr:carboxypeptidase regulatory-like domain-containing protein [Nitrososphaerota archaeon]
MSKLWNITAIAVVALLMLTMFISIASASDETTITITVSTKEGLPLKDAIVSLNGTIIGKTNSYGRITHTVSAANVTDSTICVYYVFDGHNLTISNCQSYGNATDIHITAEVVKSWPIRVWDHALRDPVPDANVTIALKSDPSLKFWKLTDQDGKAVFGIIPYEDFDVYVKYGEIYKTVESVKPTPISAYNKVEELNISLPLYRVTITVLDKKSSPVKDVNLQLKEDLEESPIASVKSGSDGKAVFKLIPRGSYYLTAYLKGVKVYESEDKEITITGDDVSKTIAVNAVKLNLTIYDYDGSDKITNYQLKGSLILNGVTVGETGSEDGVLRFGHTPFANYTLKITLGSLEVYSSPYLVNLENAEKSINAWFYDVAVEVNASSLVNATLTKSLKGTLTASTVKIDFQLKDGKAQLINVPRSTKYTASLYYGERKVQEISGVKIISEGQIVKLNLTGYKISVFTANLAGEPVNASISIILPGVGKITSFETDSKGRGVSGLLLPLSYEVEAFLDGILVGKQSLNLVSNAELHMKLSIMDVVFKILDKDGEAVLGNVSLKLVHGKFSR